MKALSPLSLYFALNRPVTRIGFWDGGFTRIAFRVP
jgi:hypothetical protein